jgi:hypothetical protein
MMVPPQIENADIPTGISAIRPHISLRWHDPNQVMGRDLAVSSQPAPADSPVVKLSIYHFSWFGKEISILCGKAAML